MQNRITWISSLRGLCVFLVFFSHLSLPINDSILFVLGRMGVVGFFLISGFLSVASLERKSNKQYLFNRLVRIYPIYWLFLLITYVMAANVGVEELLWNFTAFEEYVGYEAMIGSSWMLSIMLCFFCLLLLVRLGKFSIQHIFYVVCVFCVITGIIRYISGIPVPTAFFLLICVGIIGYMDKYKDVQKNIILFNVVLCVSSILSYGNASFWYIIAYNLGFIVYFLSKKYALNISIFNNIGKIGFSFFLCSWIPMGIILYVFPNIKNLNFIYFALIQFVSTWIFSYFVTRYFENPLLKCAKKVERNIK